MGMDRNQVIGFVLIGILLIGMFALNSKNRLAYEAKQKKIADSVAIAKSKSDSIVASKLPKKQTDTSQATLKDSLPPKTASGFALATNERFTSLENEVMKLVFTSKGGQPYALELKKFKKYNQAPVMLLRPGGFDKFSYLINASPNHTEETSGLDFIAGPVQNNQDNTQSISFTATDSMGKKITHQYTIQPNDYMIHLDIRLVGRNDLISGSNIRLNWQSEASRIEKDTKYEKTQTQLCYYIDDSYDFEHIAKNDDVKLSGQVQWVGMKQQFFTKVLIAPKKFNSAPTSWKVAADTTPGYLAQTITNASIELPGGNDVQIPLQLYYGPSDYTILKKYGNHMQEIVPYGSGIFSFVKYINRYLLLPVFDFFQSFISQMGIVILLLTLFIRLLTSPILYKSYLSGAKMKALKPEVDALRAKFVDARTGELDQQAFSMEQMKLWKSAGVSPLGGCLPALLQIPIFMSLYYFFQSNIDLRGKSFLWAEDLAAHDSILQIPDIPFYGDHVSLFTLTAVLTSLLISLYSMNNMQDNNNPLMKYMPYIFPVLLLGVFNSLPAALTWYYTISNLITLILQFIIQRYIINHDKIVLQIAENRKKPVKMSKFQERFQAMQESQKKLQDLKNKKK